MKHWAVSGWGSYLKNVSLLPFFKSPLMLHSHFCLAITLSLLLNCQEGRTIRNISDYVIFCICAVDGTSVRQINCQHHVIWNPPPPQNYFGICPKWRLISSKRPQPRSSDGRRLLAQSMSMISVVKKILFFIPPPLIYYTHLPLIGSYVFGIRLPEFLRP